MVLFFHFRGFMHFVKVSAKMVINLAGFLLDTEHNEREGKVVQQIATTTTMMMMMAMTMR